MSGTDSLKESPTEAMQEAIKDSDDLKRMTRVIAIDSLDRGLVQEDKEAAREGDKYAGDDSDIAPESEEADPMRIVAAGNVIVHQNEPPPAVSLPAEPPPDPVTPPANKAAMTLGKVALVAALAGTGGAGLIGLTGLGFAALMGAFDKPPAVTAPVAMDDQDTYAVPLFK